MAEGDYEYYTTASTTYTNGTTWTWTGEVQPFVPWRSKDERIKEIKELVKKSKKIEGVETMNLWDVYLVYAENRKSPTILPVYGVIARDEEDAKIKSGLMKSVLSEWDADYLTFIVKNIGMVKVKEKPKEVKTIK